MTTYNGFPMSVIVTGFFVTSIAYLICFCCCIIQFFIRRSRAAQRATLNAQTTDGQGMQKNDTLKRKFLAQFKDGLKKFTSRSGPEGGGSQPVDCSESCPICFDEYTDDPQKVLVGYIQKCGHYFHFDCIWRWLETRGSCPLCREKVRLTEEDIRALALCDVPSDVKSAQTAAFKDVTLARSSGSQSDLKDASSVVIPMDELGQDSSEQQQGETNTCEGQGRGVTNPGFDDSTENITPSGNHTSSSVSVFVTRESARPDV